MIFLFFYFFCYASCVNVQPWKKYISQFGSHDSVSRSWEIGPTDYLANISLWAVCVCVVCVTKQ